MSQTATKTLETPTFSPVIPALIAQISLTIGLLLFIRDLWMLAPLDHAVVTAGASGAVLYAALMGGYVVAKRAMSHTPPKRAEPSADAPAPESATAPEPASAAKPGQPAAAREPVAHASAPAALPAPPIPA